MAGTALALALASASGTDARAQQVELPDHCTGVPITLTSGLVQVHVALDVPKGLAPLAEPSSVTMRLYNQRGVIVAERSTTLAAGRTVTLSFKGSGLLRAQVDYGTPATPGPRRKVVSSVEVSEVDGFRAVIPVDCSGGETVDVRG
jgi:hypothetical protein